MEIDLRQLRYFIAVAEEGHIITRAAERLGMQQPPLSQRIKAIERELDVQLFHRKARGVELTDAGRSLFQRARAMLAEFNQAIETTRRTARGEQGRIRIGVTLTGPFHPFVPRVIRAFRQAYPLVSLTLEERPSNELVESLQNEQIDAALIRTHPADPQGLATDLLLDEELVVALPNDHVLARNRRGDAALSLKALARDTFVILGGRFGLGLYATTVAACRAAGFDPKVGQEASGPASTLNLVAIGLGISVVPASLRRMHMDGVAYRRLKSPVQLNAPLILASRRGDPSAVVRHFSKLVKRKAESFSR
jgi:DNA-binding transcriptional LysR family regulator